MPLLFLFCLRSPFRFSRNFRPIYIALNNNNKMNIKKKVRTYKYQRTARRFGFCHNIIGLNVQQVVTRLSSYKYKVMSK